MTVGKFLAPLPDLKIDWLTYCKTKTPPIAPSRHGCSEAGHDGRILAVPLLLATIGERCWIRRVADEWKPKRSYTVSESTIHCF